MKRTRKKYGKEYFIQRGMIIEFWVMHDMKEKDIAAHFGVHTSTVLAAIQAYVGNGDYVTMDIKAE